MPHNKTGINQEARGAQLAHSNPNYLVPTRIKMLSNKRVSASHTF